MRSLNRDRRKIYYAVVTGTEPIKDEYGNDTLEAKTLYGSPTLLRVSVSANAGEDAVESFGTQTEYSRIITMTGSSPFNEGTKIWFGVLPTEQHNYVVVKVADSKHCYSVALREVSKHA